MKIRDKIEEKAEAQTIQLRYQAQIKYVKWLMKEEDIDQEEALAICEGRTDPLEVKYMLGFKLADPVLQIALFKQVSKKARIQAAKNFAETLSDEEKEIFYSEVFNENTAGKFKKAYKAEKKKRGINDEE